MKIMRRMFALAGAGFLLVTPLLAQGSKTEVRTRKFLDAYVHADASKVLSVIDTNTIVYGSDEAEVFRGRSGVATMLRQDEQLWGGHATVGAMKDVSVVERKKLATIFFNAPFRVGDHAAVAVRFCMVWERHGGGWFLMQSQSAVVTQGQSAADLLKSAGK